ncbi:putative methyltransferase-like protein 7A [Hyalella azteca]|uniref:Methyltransferase-like protein 7A n=1 Tax=Hyalella azteca TaxID=294128 RepID=A0A8B7NJ22_HYAAZ|nr:putative methyltransferase-like protein 7A [Hyalella azteca]
MWSLIASFCLGFIFCKVLPNLRHRAFAAVMAQLSKSVDPTAEAFKKKAFDGLLKEQPRRPGATALRILEVGVGTGTNFKFYPEGSHLVVVDPNPYFESYYNANRAKFPNIKSEEFIVAKGEDMEMVEDNSVDVVVVSLVLCSVGDCKKFLQQVLRVLVPGGKLYFLEHVREWDSEKHPTKQRFQDWLTWLQVWPALFDGCELNRETLQLVKSAGFSEVDGQKMYAPIDNFIFQLVNPTIFGTATK